MTFKDDPTTTTDDRLALSAARNDLISTLTGSAIAILNLIIPTIMCFAPIPVELKIAIWAGGSIGGISGAAIARQSPFHVTQSLQSRSSASSSEVEIN